MKTIHQYFVTPQIRHPERSEGSPGNRQKLCHLEIRYAQDDVPKALQIFKIVVNRNKKMFVSKFAKLRQIVLLFFLSCVGEAHGK